MAIELYSEAIALDPSVATYYGNRSFAYLKTECFGFALADATKAIELDKSYVKVSNCLIPLPLFDTSVIFAGFIHYLFMTLGIL